MQFGAHPDKSPETVPATGTGDTFGSDGSSGGRMNPVRAVARLCVVIPVLISVVLSLVVTAAPRPIPPQAPPAEEVATSPRLMPAPLEPEAAPIRGLADESERVQALQDLLDTRSAAWLDRDREAYLGVIRASAVVLRERQQQLFDAAAEVPIASWSYRVVGEHTPPDTSFDTRWVAHVELRYRLGAPGDPLDGADVRRTQYLTVADGGGRWQLVDDVPPAEVASSRQFDLWDLGKVSVARGEHALVLGTAPAAVLDRFAEETDVAVSQVSRVWGRDWDRDVVVMVPADRAQMAQLLRRPEAGLEQVAAVTTGEIGLPLGAAADRVVANPKGFDALGSLGRQVVLTHETTHVATRSSGGAGLPIWLSEGFADYVAYRDAGVSDGVIARDVLDLVRAGGGPDQLPTSADFDPARATIAPAYAAAWVACKVIADRDGEQALVELVRAVTAGGDVADALERQTGLGLAELEGLWRARLRDLAVEEQT